MIYFKRRRDKEVNVVNWLIVIAVVLLLLLYIYFQNYVHTVTPYKLFVPNLHPAMKDKKIVFLSDTHFREQISHTFMDRILAEIETLDPDIILFGGDIVHKLDDNRILEHIKDFFFQLNKIAPTYVIYGNHDLGSIRLNEITNALKMSGATLLNNEARWISFGRPGIGFWLMGLSEHAAPLEKKEDVLSKISLPADSKKEPKILLAHHPHFFEKYVMNENKRPDLVLTGHAHGGQVILPIIGGLFAPGQGRVPKYDFGLFISEKYANSRMILTRGIGNSTFPLRINNRPEIVVIEFE